MKLRFFTACGLLLVFFSALLYGQSISENLARMTDQYRFVQEAEIDDPSEADQTLQLPPGYLAEAGLVNLSTWTVKRGDQSALQVQVAEMSDTLGAFALLNLWPHQFPSLGLRPTELAIGNRHSPKEGVFWKGVFFVRIRPLAGSLPLAEFVGLGRDFAAAIPFDNLLPVTVSHLPDAAREPDSVRFYLGPTWLKSNDEFPEPLLGAIGLEERVEIAFASYQPDGGALFVIGYPTVSLAQEYLVRLQDRLQSYFSKTGIFIKRSGLLVGLYIGTETRAKEVLAGVNYSPSIQWLHDDRAKQARQETVTFLGLITKAILGTGTMILLIILAGVATGLLRYGILLRFPGIVRRKEPVRLGLE